MLLLLFKLMINTTLPKILIITNLETGVPTAISHGVISNC